MSIATLQNQLSTPAGFAALVQKKSPFFSIAIGCLIASAIGIGLNLFQLGSASEWEWPLMFRYFFDAEAIEFTGGRSGRSEATRFFAVWGPVVLVPIAIILFIIYFLTRNSAGANLFAAYQSRGWIGRQRQTALTVLNGKAQVPVALIGHVDAADGYVDNAAGQYSQWLTSLDKKELKKVSAAAVKAGALKGVIANSVHPSLPGDLLVAPLHKEGELVVVISPAAGATAPYQVLPIKG